MFENHQVRNSEDNEGPEDSTPRAIQEEVLRRNQEEGSFKGEQTYFSLSLVSFLSSSDSFT